jgi:hypothetical protein
MRRGKRRVLADISDSRLLNLVEAVNPHIMAKVEHLFHDIKEQLGLRKTRLHGMVKKHCKVNMLAAFKICSWRAFS